MNAILLLTFRPTQLLLSHYQTFLRFGYDVYVVVDDIDFPFDEGQLQVVRVDDETCIKAGFRHLNPVIKTRSDCSAWDKAIYFLSHIKQDYAHVWLIEDDVFVPGGQALARMDNKYGEVDIIGREFILNASGEKSSWPHWQRIPQDLLPLPWARCLVCAVRLSQRVIQETSALVVAFNNHENLSPVGKVRDAFKRWSGETKPRTSPFIEFIFHTTALHRGYPVVEAEELQGLRWRKDWSAANFDDSCLYHPIKTQTNRLTQDHPPYAKRAQPAE